jgi:regulator of RNase E activity RraA
MTSPVERLRRLDTCAISDARDRLGLPDAAVAGIGNVTGITKVAGRAVTVRLGAPQAGPSTRHLCTAAIEAAGDDDVVVIDHQGRTDCAGWGGNLSRAARVRGIAGTLVHGAVRDVDEARELVYPVYAIAATPHTARGRAQEHAWNETITFAGVTVEPGDYVIADSTGIVFVQAPDIDAVLDTAERIAATESAIADAIARGQAASAAMGANYEQMITAP